MALSTDKSLTKVTLFLYTEDIEKLRRLEGYGWSAKIREVLHQWLKPKTTIKIHASQEE